MLYGVLEAIYLSGDGLLIKPPFKFGWLHQKEIPLQSWLNSSFLGLFKCFIAVNGKRTYQDALNKRFWRPSEQPACH